jgi:AspT/YidE/YbjL antiporter-like protein
LATLIDLSALNPVAGLFLILGAGLVIGKIRIAGVELGGVTGVLFVGLAFGHFGFAFEGPTNNVGFILFIFCVGVQAGPQFVSTFRKDGLKYAVLACMTAVTATTIVSVFAKLFQFPLGMEAGAMAGALTSTPALVAAQYESEAGSGGAGFERAVRLSEVPSIRAYRIEKTERINANPDDREHSLPVEVQRVKRGNEVLVPGDDFIFEVGDIVSMVGLQSAHEYVVAHAGPEVIDYDVLDRTTES